MANEDLKTFLIEKLQEFDPGLDVSTGSSVDQKVIAPLLSRLGIDPLSTDVDSFIRSRLRSEYPDMDTTGAGSVLGDVLTGPVELLLTPFRREITRTLASLSLANSAALTEEEADDLLANFLVSRQQGDFSTGTVRVYFSSPRPVSIAPSVTARANTGATFNALDTIDYTASYLAQRVEDGLFYVDVDFGGAAEGDAYNIPANSIISVSGISGVVRVLNKLGFAGGLARESTDALLSRAVQAVSERSPNTKNGIIALITEAISGVRSVQVIGFGDPEMKRDLLKGTITLGTEGLGWGAVITATTGKGITPVGITNIVFAQAPSDVALTNRFESSATMDAAFDVGSQLVVDGEGEHLITKRVSDTILETDLFTIITGGGTGVVPGLVLTSGAQSVFTNMGDRVKDTSKSFLLSDVKVGDWIYTWGTGVTTAPSQPLRTAYAGNSNKRFFKITKVEDTVLYIQSAQDSIYRTGASATLSSTDADTYKLTLNELVSSGAPISVGDYVALFKTGETLRLVAQIQDVQETYLDLYMTDAAYAAEAGNGALDGTAVQWVVWSSAVLPHHQLQETLNGITMKYDVLRFRSDVTDPDTYAPLIAVSAQLKDFHGREKLLLSEVESRISLTVSDVPGSVLFPNTQYGAVTVNSGEVHVGGCTDVYIHQAVYDSSSVVWSRVMDEEPLEVGIGLLDITDGGDDAPVPGDPSVDQVAPIAVTVKPRDTLYLKGHGVFRAVPTEGATRVVPLPDPGDGVADLDFELIRELKVDLNSPKKMVLRKKTTLTVVAKSVTVTDESGNFDTLGLSKGDVLEILSGDDKGLYQIKSNTASTLTLNVAITTSASNVEYLIYTPMAAPVFPLVKLTKVRVGGATGLDVPFSEPVDVRSETLINVGEGLKKSGTGNVASASTFTDANGVDLAKLGVTPGDVLDLLSGTNKGSWTVKSVSTDTITIQDKRPLNEAFTGTESGVTYQVGAPSIGNCRYWFLDPTSFEVTTGTALETEDGKAFVPDFRKKHRLIDGKLPSTDSAFLANEVWIYQVDEVSPALVVGEELIHSGNVLGVIVHVTTNKIWVSNTTAVSMTSPNDNEVVTGQFTKETATLDGVPVALTWANVLVDSKADFERDGVLLDDELQVVSRRLVSVIDGAAGFSQLSGKKLGVSVNGGVLKSITFVGADPIPLHGTSTVSGGVVQQINSGISGVTAERIKYGDKEHLLLYSDQPFVISGDATSSSLGFSNTNLDAAVAAPNGDLLHVKSVKNRHVLELTDDAGGPSLAKDKAPVMYEISRSGTQKIGAKAMKANKYGNLHYFDVEIRSVNVGNEYNLADQTKLSSVGHYGHGWKLVTENSATSFSTVEKLSLSLTPIIYQDTLEDVEGEFYLADKSFEVSYLNAESVIAAQTLLSVDDNRVVNNNPLARAIPPAEVHLTLPYAGGSSEALIKNDLKLLIDDRQPGVVLSTSEVGGIMARRSVTALKAAIELAAVRYNVDRSVDMVRSIDRLDVGRINKLTADLDDLVVTKS